MEEDEEVERSFLNTVHQRRIEDHIKHLSRDKKNMSYQELKQTGNISVLMPSESKDNVKRLRTPPTDGKAVADQVQKHRFVHENGEQIENIIIVNKQEFGGNSDEFLLPQDAY